MIEGSYGESGHDEKCEWASEACGCDSRKLLRAEIAVATKELTRLSVEIVRAERELDEAYEAIAWITGTNDVASVIAGAIAARAAEKETGNE